MHAIIKTGGKQYRVAKSQVLKVENIDKELEQSFEFDKVLMIVDGDRVEVGNPFISGVTVKAEVIEKGRGPKLEILKFKRRKHHMKRQGHRQAYTKVKITEIG